MDEHASFLGGKLILTNSCSWVVVVVVVCPLKTHTKKPQEVIVEFCRPTIYLKTSLRKKKTLTNVSIQWSTFGGDKRHSCSL
jgi:hypothetical protein